ncbi:MAG: UDP-N-acetylglucosamine 2-epimerase (non-hydrolyzing) [Lentisphaeria bacterium]|nr:UDP-N-acetylglucosamine 2-epimerase (non-hydrolyzing) [Lentisphaeria bacterium]
MKRVMVVFGTRPEAIKMVTVAKTLKKYPELFDVKVCSTGQHRQMLDQVMDFFNLKADFDLNVMSPNQTLADVTCKVLKGMEEVFLQWRPDIVLVQGDTTTVMAAALAAFYQKIDIGHVEAGLRTGNRYSPWPEEMNRLIATQLATIHFAPTATSKANLLREAVNPELVHVTGNTVIDALFEAVEIMDNDKELLASLQEKFSFLDPSRKFVLVTGHRRENFGDGFLQICRAIKQIASREDVQLVYPMHMNPNVRKPVNEILGDCKNVHLIEPQDYPSFLYLMRKSFLILTDSGGVQEEAPSLGKPVIVMRDTTERPEAVEAGTVVLAGANEKNICSYVFKLLDDEEFYKKMSKASNPYGDGQASERIADLLK